MGLALVNDFLIESETINLMDASSQLTAEANLVIPSYLMHNFKLAKVYSSNKSIIQIETVYHEEQTQ